MYSLFLIITLAHYLVFYYFSDVAGSQFIIINLIFSAGTAKGPAVYKKQRINHINSGWISVLCYLHKINFLISIKNIRYHKLISDIAPSMTGLVGVTGRWTVASSLRFAQKIKIRSTFRFSQSIADSYVWTL